MRSAKNSIERKAVVNDETFFNSAAPGRVARGRRLGNRVGIARGSALVRAARSRRSKPAPNFRTRRKLSVGGVQMNDSSQSRGDFLPAMVSLHLNVDLELALGRFCVGCGGPGLRHAARSIRPSFV